jgi:hypothetical protein
MEKPEFIVTPGLARSFAEPCILNRRQDREPGRDVRLGRLER